MYPCDRKLTKNVLFKLFLICHHFFRLFEGLTFQTELVVKPNWNDAETGKERKQSEATYDLFTDHVRHEIQHLPFKCLLNYLLLFHNCDHYGVPCLQLLWKNTKKLGHSTGMLGEKNRVRYQHMCSRPILLFLLIKTQLMRLQFLTLLRQQGRSSKSASWEFQSSKFY